MFEKTLVLIFQNQKGTSVRFSIDDAKEDLTSTDVQELMRKIIEKNVFNSNGGDFVSASGAEIVTRTVEQLSIA